MPNPQWTANSPISPSAVIIDINGNVQLTYNGGTTGATMPTWSSVDLSTTQDNTVAWVCVAVLEPTILPSGPTALPPPVFLPDADGLNPSLILNDMINTFQSAAGRTLYPAQVERLLIDLYAYREALVRNAIQYCGQQNLLAFAIYPMLDYLGQLLGVAREQATGAVTTLQFTLTAALTISKTIPAGTLAGTQDGQFQFATNQPLTIPAGSTTGSIGATCTTPGPTANGYAVGQVSVSLAGDAQISAVSNTNVTGGGASPETDAHLRTRIQAAPNQFSVAGPANAYRYFALSVNPSIIDVAVTTPVPGTVNVYVLTGPITVQPASSPNNAGIANSTLLAQVLAALSADDVRPLTDTVVALAVTEVDYAITGTVTLFADADVASTGAAVNAAAQEIALALASRIERDIVPSEIVAALSVPGVYQVVLSAPSYTQLTAGQWANCTAINLTIAQGTERS
jgi:phage-related baseplate assembly protein